MSALVIEDGTNVAGATSYASLTTVRAFALARGVTLSTDDDVLDALTVKAMDYVESYRDRFKGDKSNSDQSLQFPRTDVYVDGLPVGSDEIPQELVNALCQLVMVAVSTDLAPQGDGKVVVKEKVGPLETQYGVGGSDAPSLSSPPFPDGSTLYWLTIPPEGL